MDPICMANLINALIITSSNQSSVRIMSGTLMTRARAVHAIVHCMYIASAHLLSEWLIACQLYYCIHNYWVHCGSNIYIYLNYCTYRDAHLPVATCTYKRISATNTIQVHVDLPLSCTYVVYSIQWLVYSNYLCQEQTWLCHMTNLWGIVPAYRKKSVVIFKLSRSIYSSSLYR